MMTSFNYTTTKTKARFASTANNTFGRKQHQPNRVIQ